MGNQHLNAAALVPHKSLLSTLVVKVWRVPHLYNGTAEQEEGVEGEEVVIVLR